MDSDDYRDDDIMTIDVEYVELSSIITQLNKRKAPGHDKVVNEHLIYGGTMLGIYLQKLFTLILNACYIPHDCKLGVIIPIHKTNKPKYQWCTYPPITLLPVIY